MHIKAGTHTNTHTHTDSHRQTKQTHFFHFSWHTLPSTCTNILLMLQNIIAADGALHILWSTVGIKDVKRRINPLYCWVMFHLHCIPFRQSVWLVSCCTNNKNIWRALLDQVTASYFTCEYNTSKEIKSSLKINYMHLCQNSRYVQVFLSVSQNTFSQWLIPIDHNNRSVKCAEEECYLEIQHKLQHKSKRKQDSLVYNYEQHNSYCKHAVATICKLCTKHTWPENTGYLSHTSLLSF